MKRLIPFLFVASTTIAAPDGYLVTDGVSYTTATVISNTALGAIVQLPNLSNPAMYTVWPYEVDGGTNYAAPFQINRTEAFFAAPDIASTGDTVRVVGTAINLTNSVASKVWCEEESEWVTASYNDFYMMEFSIPSTWSAGTKTLYPHNGFGKEYGISPVGVQITVANKINYTTATNTVASTNWTDIAAAYAATTANETLFFPGGSNVVYNIEGDWNSPPDNIRIYGTGAVLRVAASYSDATGSSCIFDGFSSWDGVEISGLTLDAGFSDVGLDCLMGMSGDRNFVHDTNFTMTNAIPLGPTYTLSAGTAYFNSINGHPIIIKDCNFWYIKYITAAGGVIFDSCVTYGHSADQTGGCLGGTASGSYTKGNGKNKIIISNEFRQADTSTTNVMGWCGGRIVTHQGNYIASYNEYYGNNTAIDYGPPPSKMDKNAGEMFLWEGIRTMFQDYPSSATSTTLVFNVLNTNNTAYVYTLLASTGVRVDTNEVVSTTDVVITISGTWDVTPTNNIHYMQIPRDLYSETSISSSTSNSVTMGLGNRAKNNMANFSIAIVEGVGYGQTRHITGFDKNTGTVTIDKPWRVNPTTNSLVSIGTFPHNIIISGNNVGGSEYWDTFGSASTFDELYGGGAYVYVDGNSATNLNSSDFNATYPYYFCSTEANRVASPLFFYVNRNNYFANMRRNGQILKVEGSDSWINKDSTPVYGAVYTDNVISNVVDGYALYISQYYNPPAGGIIEGLEIDSTVFWETQLLNVYSNYWFHDGTNTYYKEP